MASLPLPSLETRLQLHAETALSLVCAALFTWLWRGADLHALLPRQGEQWLAWAVFFWPLWRTGRHILRRPRQRQLGDLIGLYIGLVLQFAVVYYLFALLLSGGSAFHGMTPLYDRQSNPLPASTATPPCCSWTASTCPSPPRPPSAMATCTPPTGRCGCWPTCRSSSPVRW
ncbi:Uncharacterised protein [Chromobacterium violaceum]|uniref:Uncharacterized protein n=1 Tax=Chromobacterium violaceum TaxID=536 RepID=A0A447TF19_CHRVL|nr:Uncharacterised protein [Chromobacterium violaceum]